MSIDAKPAPEEETPPEKMEVEEPIKSSEESSEKTDTVEVVSENVNSESAKNDSASDNVLERRTSQYSENNSNENGENNQMQNDENEEVLLICGVEMIKIII